MKNTAKDFTKTYGPGGHHPSKPYHPPAINKGGLVSKMNVASRSYGAVWYIDRAKHAPWLETGLDHAWPIDVRRRKVLSDGLNFFGMHKEHPGI